LGKPKWLSAQKGQELKSLKDGLSRFLFFSFFLSMIVPSLAWGERVHFVEKGESLSTIAQDYHLFISAILEANGLEETTLQIGQRLIIPQPYSPDQSRFLGRKVLPLEDAPGAGQSADEAERSNIQPCNRDGSEGERGNQTLVRIARSLLGVKYRKGGMSLIHGLDCSAFVQKVFRAVGVEIPRTAREQFEVGVKVTRGALRLGDLVFFKLSSARLPTHVGIYIGDGQFIHTSRIKRKVYVDSLNIRYFSSRFMGGRRMRESWQQPETDKSNYAALSEAHLKNSGALQVSPSFFQ
jgi:peptidoglycan endopeptidase LytE